MPILNIIPWSASKIKRSRYRINFFFYIRADQEPPINGSVYFSGFSTVEESNAFYREESNKF
jgi:hypothetical protein